MLSKELTSIFLFARLSLRCLHFFPDILAYHAVGSTEYSKGLYNRETLTTLDKNSDALLVTASSSEYYNVIVVLITKKGKTSLSHLLIESKNDC